MTGHPIDELRRLASELDYPELHVAPFRIGASETAWTLFLDAHEQAMRRAPSIASPAEHRINLVLEALHEIAGAS